MKPFKVMAHIHSLNGEMDEVTVLEERTSDKGEKYYIVSYKDKLCTAIFNWFVEAYFTDDIYGIVE